MIKLLEKHFIISGIISLLIAIFIFYISSLSFISGSPGPEFELKPIIYHFFIFFFLTFFLVIFLTQGKKKELLFLGIILVFTYAVTDEIHQFFVPNRSCSFFDIFIDSLGDRKSVV